MTKRRQTNDVQQDKSDIMSILSAIEQIYNLCQSVLNTHAQTALMLSLTIETQMLLLKLQAMHERWQYHLPFKEACEVNFGKWSTKVERMASAFADTASESDEPISEYCPSKHFLLDLYDLLPESKEAENNAPYYQETVMSRYIINQERIRKQITQHWEAYYKQRFSDHVASQIEHHHGIALHPLCDERTAIRIACYEILTEVSKELSMLNELQEPDIQPEQFARLADRVFAESDYGGRQARDSARHDVKTWRNKTPKHKLEKSRKEEIDTSMKIIEEMRHGQQIIDYIGEDLDIRGHSEGVGQFLHNVRKDISKEELKDLMEQLFRIQFFRENKEQQEKKDTPKASDEATPVTQQGTEATQAVSPQRPKLPCFFKSQLSENSKATRLFYDILHQTERYMYGRLNEGENSFNFLLYKNWKWNHLRVAFAKSGFIDDNTPKQHFAEFIHQVFPYIKTPSIVRSIQRYGESSLNFYRIVKEIEKEFQEVRDMIEV